MGPLPASATPTGPSMTATAAAWEAEFDALAPTKGLKAGLSPKKRLSAPGDDAAFAEAERRVWAVCGSAYHAKRGYVIEWESNELPSYPCDLYCPPPRLRELALQYARDAAERGTFGGTSVLGQKLDFLSSTGCVPIRRGLSSPSGQPQSAEGFVTEDFVTPPPGFWR